MELRTLLTETEFSPAELLQEFVDACRGEGAVVSFCGLARGKGVGDEPVSALRLERHPHLTERSLEHIGQDAAARFDVARSLIVHRWGRIAPGEAIVFVATSARHRRAAFLAADYLMDRLKTDAVLWKKEEGADGGRWIEPTDEDRAALARWDR